MGLVHYMAPELFTIDTPKLSAKADIYSLGVLMWELFTGEPPWSDLNPAQVVVQVSLGRRLALQASTHLPEAYDSIFKQCTATEPGERPPAGTMVKELMQMMSQQPPL